MRNRNKLYIVIIIMTPHRKYTICARVFPKLSAYGRAIEAGADASKERFALDQEMRNNPEEMRYAITEAIGIQTLLAETPIFKATQEDHERAPQRLERLQGLLSDLNTMHAQKFTREP